MIDMQLLISGIIFGLSLGGIFFLMTIGLSLCFGLMRIISLDQLLYYSIGGYITYSVSLAVGNIWLGVLGGVVVGGLAALAVERIVFRRPPSIVRRTACPGTKPPISTFPKCTKRPSAFLCVSVTRKRAPFSDSIVPVSPT